jgi:hypothetical protein
MFPMVDLLCPNGFYLKMMGAKKWPYRHLSFTEHKSILKVLTISLGVYGGLTVILRFFVPLLVRLWWNRETLIRTEPNTRKFLVT